MVGAAVNAFGGDVRAYAVSLLRQGLFYEALEARVSSGCVRLIAADATVLSIEGAFLAASSRAAELPAEGAPSSGGGRPYRPGRADTVEEQDAVLNEREGVCWGHLDHQGRGELGDTVPGSEGLEQPVTVSVLHLRWPFGGGQGQRRGRRQGLGLSGGSQKLGRGRRLARASGSVCRRVGPFRILWGVLRGAKSPRWAGELAGGGDKLSEGGLGALAAGFLLWVPEAGFGPSGFEISGSGRLGSGAVLVRVCF